MNISDKSSFVRYEMTEPEIKAALVQFLAADAKHFSKEGVQNFV